MSPNKVAVILAVVFLLVSPLLIALPENGVVVAGSASISQSENKLTIQQDSWNAVINWKNFDTAANETVVFNQPHVFSTVLNRINSGLPTNFAGNLIANGRVFIVNPAGMIFVQGSKINAASFIATTADIQDDDFMNKNYKFYTKPEFDQAVIINNGKITADTGGMVALIAPTVSNGHAGIIEAYMGTVELASGKNFVVDFNQDNLINFDISNLANAGSVENAGKISANGGRVIMSTEAVSHVLDNVMNMSGVIEANNARVFYTGEVELFAGKTDAVNISGKINAYKISINSGKGIAISGELKTTQGFHFANISLTTGGAITETETGEIQTMELNTIANNGIILDSKNNNTLYFSATNWVSGNVSYVNTNFSHNPLANVVLVPTLILQNGGDLSITTNGRIIQDEPFETASPMVVSGSSTFITTGVNGPVSLSSKDSSRPNEFKGPVTIISGNDIVVDNTKFGSTLTLTAPGDASVRSQGDLILGNLTVGGQLNIQTTAHGIISFAPNTAKNTP